MVLNPGPMADAYPKTADDPKKPYVMWSAHRTSTDDPGKKARRDARSRMTAPARVFAEPGRAALRMIVALAIVTRAGRSVPLRSDDLAAPIASSCPGLDARPSCSCRL
jgi:hypothetical protein